MKLNEAIKNERIKLKIKQQDLAGAVGISRPQLSKMENGKKEIPFRTAERLKEVLYRASREKDEADRLAAEQSDVASNFKDLAKVLSDAYTDGVINYFEAHKHGFDVPILYEDIGTVYKNDYHSISRAILMIEQQYKEEFTVETMSDELKIKSGAEVTLANGIKCTYFDDGRRKLRHDGDFYDSSFLLLKGAKVKQSKKD